MIYLIALYAALASPVWQEREAAEQALLRLVDRHPALYGPRLLALAREATEPEVRSRMRAVAVAYRRALAASYVPSGVPVWPCSDMHAAPCSWLVYPRRRQATTAAGTTLASGPWWWTFRETTEQMARSMIRNEGFEPAEVDRILQRMWAVEQMLKGDCPSAWPAAAATWTTWRGGYPCPK